MTSLIARGVRSIARFWAEFLFGDTPVLFPVTLAIVGIAYGLRHERAAAVVVVPALVAALIALSAYVSARRAPTADAQGAPQRAGPTAGAADDGE
ncbi:MAG: hypothetical protein ACRDVW_08265 [Acidimicrobiales bacterium]